MIFTPLESPETRREDRYGRALVTAIIGITLLVGLLDFWTSPDLVGSILFTIPVALCAKQRSNRLLWGTTVVAVFLTIAAGVWGFSRSAPPDLWDVSVNRGLLVANLLTLATFIQLWIRNKQQHTILKGRYYGLLEAAPDAMVVVNQGGEIVLSNTQAEKQFGYLRGELVGQKVKTIIPEGFAERLIADGTRSPAKALAQQIGTGNELSGRRKDESEFPIEIMLSPLENTEGILVTAAIRDISARKDSEKHLAQMESTGQQTEDALRESEESYRRLLDGVEKYAIFMMDPHGKIVSWNAGAERIKGYTAGEIIGQGFSCFFPAAEIKRGRPAEILRLTRRQRLGTKRLACTCGKTGPNSWPISPSRRCATEREICGDFLNSATISARARSPRRNTGDCWRLLRMPWWW